MDLLCIPRGGPPKISTQQDISETLVGFHIIYGEGLTSTHSQNPGLQNLRTAITSFLASHAHRKKHTFTLLFFISLPPPSTCRLFQRCQDPSVSTKYQAAQLDDLFQVLRLLVVPEMCFQVVLESALSHPDDATIPDDPCGCRSFCKDSFAFPAVDQAGVVHVLFSLFLHGDDRITSTTTVDKVIRAMIDFEDITMHLLRSLRTSAEPLVNIKKLLLTLIMADILTLQFRMAA
jgi:hypothetical protein